MNFIIILKIVLSLKELLKIVYIYIYLHVYIYLIGIKSVTVHYSLHMIF